MLFDFFDQVKEFIDICDILFDQEILLRVSKDGIEQVFIKFSFRFYLH